MRLPIDTNGMNFVVAGAAEPVRDFETKQQKVDEGGALVFAVALMVLGKEQPEIISVKLSGEAPTVTPGQTAKVHGLVATPWSMGERSGVSYRALRLETASGTARQAG
jgi:hypothetical protein